MSGLFHRRTRSTSAQRTQAPSSSSAHMAATQAFLSNRASQSNLSTSAAAAALRAMSPPPTQVAEVQTKRMQRRASNASHSQSPRGRSTGGLDRQSSNGSMTERTFRRSPSPGRPVSQGQTEVAPPVPKLPRDIPPPPPFSTQTQRRAVSLGAPPTRVYSPASRTFVTVATNPSPGPLPTQKTSVAPSARQPQTDELQRSDSRNSINFSYPRPASPPVRSPATPISPTYPLGEEQLPRTLRNGITPAQAEIVKYDVTHAAQAPVKKKKKKAAPRSAEGSHLSSGSMASRPVTTPLEPGPTIPTQPAAEPVKKTKKKVAPSGESSHFPSDPDLPISDTAAETSRRTQRASGVLTKKPSIVREDWEGEQQQEQSEAQTREEQGLSPVSSPASVQNKKTTAANMSRKIEEPQAQPKQPPAPVYHAVTTDEPASPTLSNAPNEQYLHVEHPQPRTVSLSPSRSTRFSDRLSSDLAEGRKHEPLPRSVSPAKSALKHHGQGPLHIDPHVQHVRGASTTPSDASDSNMSADGSVRRKSARVSFEPDVEVVGTAAESQQNDPPTLASPQNKDMGKRGFFGLGRSKPPLTTIPSEEDVEEHMKPRPQLPSFGSIRSKARRADSSDSVEAAPPRATQQLAPAATQSSSASSETSSSGNAGAMDQGVSSDHAIGGFLAQEVANQAAKFSPDAPALAPPRRDPNLPLPPEVTSVEGTGYVSDSDSDLFDQKPSDDKTSLDMPRSVQPATSNDLGTSTAGLETTTPTQAPSQAVALSEKAPKLALQPPTPSIEQGAPTDQWEVEVPGGFPGSTENITIPNSSREALPVKDEESAVTPSDLGMAEPATPLVGTVASTEPAESLEEEDESEDYSDNASIYSDAAEDLSDLEGDGFGSINAIVESPIVASSQTTHLTTPPQSPLAQVSNRSSEAARTTSWDETQEKWSGIAKLTREPGVPEPSTAQPVKNIPGRGLEDSKWAQAPAEPDPAANIQSKPKKIKKRTSAATAAALAPGASLRQPPAESPSKAKNQTSAYPQVDPSSSFRRSMRTQPVAQASSSAKFRGSLRAQPPAEAGTGFRSSMRGPPAPSRPRSPPQAPAVRSSPPRAALQKKHIPPAPTMQPRAAPASQPLQKTLSNDSDSDSSFQRTRRSKLTTSATYSMKRSMRTNAGPRAPPMQPAERGAVRSSSPPQRRPFSPTGEPKGFRSSMRASFNDTGPTLRGQPEPRASSSLFGKQKNKSPSPAKPAAFSSTIASRFKDSGDEDEPRTTTFRSRFQDSSDDDPEPYTFRPVRGIPRKADEGDSTDLSDSSYDEQKAQKAPKAKPQPPTINTTGPASTTQPNVSLSPTSPTKKKGFFSRLRSKKDHDDSKKPSLAVTSSAPVAARATEEEKDEGMGNIGFSSTAERDEMIRQTMAKLEAAKQSEEKSSNSPTTASKPQRQGMGQRIMSDSWPLSEKTEVAPDMRPSTSSGVLGKTNGTAMRPGLGQRIPTSETDNSLSGGVYGRSGKKKRFPMLRKAFGLKD